MTAAVPSEPAASARRNRYRQASATLETFGQAHVLASWDQLTGEQQDALLRQIEGVDWGLVTSLHDELVQKGRPPVRLPDVPWRPAEPLEPNDDSRAAGEAVLRETGAARFAILVLAGGTGSRLKFPHAKGLFPATPLTGKPLYQVMVEKSKAAAREFGHDRMFPMVVMLSDETADETRQYFEANDYFSERDRILLVNQEVLPLLDRRPGREGKAVLASSSELALGGAGHGDALDVVLPRDPAARWLAEHGVRYVQLVNVDNPLAPIADRDLLGMHARSAMPAQPGKAHISVMLISKTASPRLGSIIEYEVDGHTVQQSTDYGVAPDVDDRCPLGHANLQVVTLESLPGSAPIPFAAVPKEITVAREQIPVWKFERSAVHKARYGALLQRASEDVFAPIKQRNEDGSIETPAAATSLQSEHWKRILRRANAVVGSPLAFAATSQLELPWEADYLEPAELAARLRELSFPTVLAADTSYVVTSRFADCYVIQPENPDGDRTQGSKSKKDPDAAESSRRRALIATYNNAFGHDPDVLVRAPGRNTAIGDHMDYPPLPQDGSASSHTVAWATQQDVLVAAGLRPDHGIELLAVNEGQSFTIRLDDLEGLASEAAHNNLREIYGQPLYPWAMSTLALLYSAARGVPGVRTPLPLYGAAFVFEGSVPQGAGQSSSAALLVALTLACNELFGWGIPLSEAFTLADIARSGEHEDYSPFITKGRAGYLDQMVSLTAREGKAVVIDHGNYASPEWIDLDAVEQQGYRNVVVLSGLSRALGETAYATRVEELSRLPAAMNTILARHRPDWTPRSHVHQFTPEEWHEVRAELESEFPVLGQRARYVFEERERTTRFREALAAGHIDTMLDAVNGSGVAMSMNGPYQISGHNQVPAGNQRIAALDTLREIVLRHAGPRAAARMIGGGGAGPLYVLAPAAVADTPGFAQHIVQEWRRATGLSARVLIETPASGAEVLWRRSTPHVLHRGSG